MDTFRMKTPTSKERAATYRSGRSPDWLKMKNSDAPAVKREAEEDWGGRSAGKKRRGKHGLGPKHGAEHLP
jgi:ATP-dependent DNA ligase